MDYVYGGDAHLPQEQQLSFSLPHYCRFICAPYSSSMVITKVDQHNQLPYHMTMTIGVQVLAS